MLLFLFGLFFVVVESASALAPASPSHIESVGELTLADALARCRQFAVTHLRNREQSVASYMHVCFELAFAKRPLVFGLGLDSRIYLALNRHVMFVENNAEWIQSANLACDACVVNFNYSTVMQDGVVLRDDEIPSIDADALRGQAFDFILVDAPHGRKAGEPGRYQPIKFAAQQRAAGHLTLVCVHDLQRPLESALFARYFGSADDLLSNGLGGQKLGCKMFRNDTP
jgi:hypothetical protein